VLEGVRLGKQDLIARFGMSQRLAVRIGALLAKHVEVTETVLEMAGPGSALERVLLHPQLLEQADALSTRSLGRLVAEVDKGMDPLAVVTGDEGRLICLEEERLAEQGFGGDEGAGEAGTPARREASGDVALLGEQEAREMFGPAEIARMKLDALTSADPATRISAIRRLRYAPLSRQEKGGVFLQVLLDPISPVRSEAIDALEGLGFDRDSAQALRDIFSGNEEERNLALDRVGVLLGRLGASEKQVVLTILIEAFREFGSTTSQEHVLRILAEAAEHVVQRRENVREIIRAAVNRLLMQPRELSRPVQTLMLRLSDLVPEEVAAALWGELDTVRNPDLRALLLDIIASTPLSEERKGDVARVILEEIGGERLSETNRQRIGHALARLGGPAVAPLLETFERGDARMKLMLVPLRLRGRCAPPTRTCAWRSRVPASLPTGRCPTACDGRWRPFWRRTSAD